MPEYLVFVALIVGGFGASRYWLRRVGRAERRPWLLACLLATIVIAGYFLADAAGRQERWRLQQMVEGFAPTYAREIERLGHARLPLQPDSQDPIYLALIDAEIRWLAINPSVADISTMRKLPDGRNVFIVDSETDYDHDGRYEGDRESRTEIGEVYEEDDPALERAFAGESIFSDEPVTDRWGTWVSAWVPLRDPDGRLDGVLGVDYEASLWVGAIARARAMVLGALALLAFLLLGANTVMSILRADLAERQRAEAQARGLNVELEQRVAERTAALAAANAELKSQIAEREAAQATVDRMHQELLKVSRQAGMAEVATGVLHNVGNVLNSVNVSSKLVADTVRASRLASFVKLAALLREHEQDLAAFLTTDAKGRQVPQYLLTLADHLAREQRFLTQELESLRKHIEHIRQVVSMQQGNARSAGVVEKLAASELVEDAVQINNASLTRHQIAVVREFARVPAVVAERHKVIQVLVNLIRNAQQALATAEHERRLTLRIAGNGNGRVRISVRDNGSGIAAEAMPRLFSHGFTTKAGGHGFGLHNSALAVKEMGGTLTAHSDGPERGAEFTIELPADDGG